MNKIVRLTPDTTVIKLLNKVIETSDNLIIPSYNKISKEDFLKIRIPDTDSPKDYLYEAGTLSGFSKKYLLAAKTLLNANFVRNYRYSYPESFLNWHTDSDFTGTRLYYTYTNAESIFKYADADRVVYTDYDAVGEWTCRQFTINPDTLLWHSVWNKDIRYVFGFSL